MKKKKHERENVLLRALQAEQEKNEVLTGMLEVMQEDVEDLHNAASAFLDYDSPVEVEGPIPITVSFLDFDDREQMENILGGLSNYPDKIKVVAVRQGTLPSVSANKYIVLQPQMPLSPAGAYSTCSELLKRRDAIVKDIVTGSMVNAAIQGDDEEEKPRDSQKRGVALYVFQPDREFYIDGNILNISSRLYDLGKVMPPQEKKHLEHLFQEYHVIVEEWDSQWTLGTRMMT